MNKKSHLHHLHICATAGLICGGGISTVHAQSSGLVTLQNFDVQPQRELLTAADGNFYGIYSGYGEFRMTPQGEVSYVNAMSFGCVPDNPNALTQGSDSNFYGTTEAACYTYGTYQLSEGNIFKLTATGQITALYQFGPADLHVTDPVGALAEGKSGVFYGVTYGSGHSPWYGGTVFSITSTGVFTLLYTFSDLDASGYNQDGASPRAGLVKGADGNFYGTTSAGGANGVGTLFKITPTGTFTKLHDFNLPYGGNPYSPLVLASDGNFYGTTYNGGKYGDGVIYRMAPDGTYTRLYSFSGSTGLAPASKLVETLVGTVPYLFGTTTAGGSSNEGTIFSMTLDGKFHSLDSFPTTGGGGFTPNGPAVGHDGNIYGTTLYGGLSLNGTAYELIVQQPVISLKLSPASVGLGQHASLTWTTTSTTSCAASGAWAGAEPLVGSQTVSQSVAGKYKYTLTCSGPLGIVAKTATLTVQ